MSALDDSVAVPSVWRYRLKEAEETIKTKADKEYVDTIADEVRGLRKAVIGAALAIMGSAVLVSLTLFATLGSHIAGG